MYVLLSEMQRGDNQLYIYEVLIKKSFRIIIGACVSLCRSIKIPLSRTQFKPDMYMDIELKVLNIHKRIADVAYKTSCAGT